MINPRWSSRGAIRAGLVTGVGKGKAIKVLVQKYVTTVTPDTRSNRWIELAHGKIREE